MSDSKEKTVDDRLRQLEQTATLDQAQKIGTFYHELIRLGLSEQAATDLAIAFFVKLVESKYIVPQ